MEETVNKTAAFQRQIILPEVGPDGQEKLRNAKVLVVGAGGLGCPALQYLTSSGVGQISVVDGDRIEVSNLSRQVLFGPQDIGRKKVEAAAERLKALSSDVRLRLYDCMLDESNASELVGSHDLVLDCTDNYKVRYLLSDVTAKTGKPLIYAALHRYEGQLAVFNYKNGPSFRDLYPDQAALEAIPTCVEVGVLSVLPGIMGVMQATEAIKIILDLGEVSSGKLLIYNSLRNELHSTQIN